jgi:hypothetical protein
MTDHYAPLRDLLQVWRDKLPYKGSQWEERHDHIKDCADELDRALEEVALLPFDSDLVRDAERYRWLRDNRRAAIPEFQSGWDVVSYINGGEEESIISAQTLDAAIDAAMQPKDQNDE